MILFDQNYNTFNEEIEEDFNEVYTMKDKLIENNYLNNESENNNECNDNE